MSRITSLATPLIEIIVTLADGNPGAVVAMSGLVKSVEETDPDNALGAFGPILFLDTLEIYGSSIWILYSDICGKSPTNMLAILRAVQLGIARDSEIKRGIADYRLSGDREENGRRVRELLAAVQAQLPRFASGIETEGHDPVEGHGAKHESPTAESRDAQNNVPPLGGWADYMSAVSTWARAFGTGLSSFGSSLLRSLAALRFNPSRIGMLRWRGVA